MRFTTLSLSLILFGVSWLAALTSLLVTGYHLLLGIVAFTCRSDKNISANLNSRFIVLIPAHNEETALSTTIASCRAQDYPIDRFKIVVVADNCSDGTTAIAKECGAICWERTDPIRRGKGHALAWGIARAMEQHLDAIVVVDADCTLDSNGLAVLNDHLLAGHDAVQLNNVPNNADDCPISYLLAVANKLENDFFYAPKNRLGMAVFLRGTGMMLSRELLQTCPWQSNARAEDAEYSVGVLGHGYRVYFDQRSSVRSAAPTYRLQLSTQRKRWVGGQFQVAISSLGTLLRGAFLNRDLRLIDAAWTSFILLRIIVLSVVLGALGVAGICAYFLESYDFRVPFAVSLISIALLGTYASIGVLAMGLTNQRLKLLCSAIPEAIRYSVLSAKACLERNFEWTRTER